MLYPSVLLVLVLCLVVFLVTYVVPSFAQLYSTMSATLPALTRYLIAIGTTAKSYVLAFAAALVGAIVLFRFWARSESAQEKLDRLKLHAPVLGRIWIMYQVGQFARVLSTLLVGGIPLVQALETASESMSSSLIRKSLDKAKKMVREGQPLSVSISSTGVFPGLAVDMIEVGESTGALPSMLIERGRVLRRGREHSHDRGAVAHRAGDHDVNGIVCGFCLGGSVSADLLTGG